MDESFSFEILSSFGGTFVAPSPKLNDGPPKVPVLQTVKMPFASLWELGFLKMDGL
jgi:hypothetical protein